MLGKARELGGFAGIAFAVLLSAVLTTGVASAASWILDSLGWGASATVVLRVVGILVAFVVDAAIFLLVVTVLAGQHAPWRDLRRGAVIAAVGIGVVRILGTEVVAGSVNKNPLFASVAVIVTLLVWVNLIARIVLLAAAWTADPPFVEPEPDRRNPPTAAEPRATSARPAPGVRRSGRQGARSCGRRVPGGACTGRAAALGSGHVSRGDRSRGHGRDGAGARRRGAGTARTARRPPVARRPGQGRCSCGGSTPDPAGRARGSAPAAVASSPAGSPTRRCSRCSPR